MGTAARQRGRLSNNRWISPGGESHHRRSSWHRCNARLHQTCVTMSHRQRVAKFVIFVVQQRLARWIVTRRGSTRMQSKAPTGVMAITSCTSHEHSCEYQTSPTQLHDHLLPYSSEIKGKEQPQTASYGGPQNPFLSHPSAQALTVWRLFHDHLPYDHAPKPRQVKSCKARNPAIAERTLRFAPTGEDIASLQMQSTIWIWRLRKIGPAMPSRSVIRMGIDRISVPI